MTAGIFVKISAPPASIPGEHDKPDNATKLRNMARLFRPDSAWPVHGGQEPTPVLALCPAGRAALFRSWIERNVASEIWLVPRQLRVPTATRFHHDGTARKPGWRRLCLFPIYYTRSTEPLLAFSPRFLVPSAPHSAPGLPTPNR